MLVINQSKSLLLIHIREFDLFSLRTKHFDTEYSINSPKRVSPLKTQNRGQCRHCGSASPRYNARQIGEKNNSVVSNITQNLYISPTSCILKCGRVSITFILSLLPQSLRLSQCPVTCDGQTCSLDPHRYSSGLVTTHYEFYRKATSIYDFASPSV